MFCYSHNLHYLCNMKAKKFFQKFASRFLWLNLLGMVVVLVLLIFGLKWWLLKYTHHGEGIEVPDLYGVDYRDAMKTVEGIGLRITINDSTYIKDKPAGCIVVQSPDKGMKVKEGRMVYVTINSLTIPRVAIPDLAGNSSYRQAVARLQALELRVNPPKLIDGDKDWVYGMLCEGREVHRGDMVARESQITLIIGNGATDDYEYGWDFDDLQPFEEEGAEHHATEQDEEVETDDFEPVDLNVISE